MKVIITTVTTAEGNAQECAELIRNMNLKKAVTPAGCDCASMQPENKEPEIQEDVITETKENEEKENLEETLEQILEEGDPKHFKREANTPAPVSEETGDSERHCQDSDVPISDEEDAAWEEAVQAAVERINKARADGISAKTVKEAFNG